MYQKALFSNRFSPGRLSSHIAHSPNECFSGFVSATPISGDAADEVPKAVAALKKGKVKQVEIGGKEFWTAEIKENSPAGKMHTFTFTTSMANYTLQFALLSFDAKLAEKLRRSIESISFFEPIQAKVIAGDNARLFPVRQANNAAETCFGPPHIRKAA